MYGEQKKGRIVISAQIVCTPGVLGGQPRMDGTRISVAFIVELFSLQPRFRQAVPFAARVVRFVPRKGPSSPGD